MLKLKAQTLTLKNATAPTKVKLLSTTGKTNENKPVAKPVIGKISKGLVDRILNSSSSLLQIVNNHLINYATPKDINYFWSFGSLAGLFFFFQIVSGIVLAMHYTAHVTEAFNSVDHIMVDVRNGWLARYAHANGASVIFIFMYLHIARTLYYQSFMTKAYLWYTGIVIFLLMMATAFIGYVLPWGQMSFWGATVITNLVTAIPGVGKAIAFWIWGGFSINNATLTRFFALHYLLPFLITGLILIHLSLLHVKGSSSPTGLPNLTAKVPFHAYFFYKDAIVLSLVFFFFTLLVFFFPNLLGHSDNFIPANPLVTPAHIVPEWYFTPFYAILRACPNKIGGALSMLLAILIWFVLPVFGKFSSHSPKVDVLVTKHSLGHQIAFALFVVVFLSLMFLGSNPAAEPFVFWSKIFTCLYFAYFLYIIPLLIYFNNCTLNSTLPVC
jgi:quinol-cytochrome oxidoreductase complex cytochrome b subunit